jgi:hypothetical protein
VSLNFSDYLNERILLRNRRRDADADQSSFPDPLDEPSYTSPLHIARRNFLLWVVPCVSLPASRAFILAAHTPFSLRPEGLSSAAHDLMVWVTEVRGRRNTRVYRDSEGSSTGGGLSLIRDRQVDPEPRIQELNDFIYGWARSRRLTRMVGAPSAHHAATLPAHLRE